MDLNNLVYLVGGGALAFFANKFIPRFAYLERDNISTESKLNTYEKIDSIQKEISKETETKYKELSERIDRGERRSQERFDNLIKTNNDQRVEDAKEISELKANQKSHENDILELNNKIDKIEKKIDQNIEMNKEFMGNIQVNLNELKLLSSENKTKKRIVK